MVACDKMGFGEHIECTLMPQPFNQLKAAERINLRVVSQLSVSKVDWDGLLWILCSFLSYQLKWNWIAQFERKKKQKKKKNGKRSGIGRWSDMLIFVQLNFLLGYHLSKC